VGPDGTVQLCYVTFKLGNLHGTRLRDLVFTKAHEKASRDAFSLNCPQLPLRLRQARAGSRADSAPLLAASVVTSVRSGGRVAPADYPAFAGFASAVDAAQEEPIAFQRSPQGEKGPAIPGT